MQKEELCRNENQNYFYHPVQSYPRPLHHHGTHLEHSGYFPPNSVETECPGLINPTGYHQTNQTSDGQSSHGSKIHYIGNRHVPTEYHFTVNGKVSFNPGISVNDYEYAKPGVNEFHPTVNQLYDTVATTDESDTCEILPPAEDALKCEQESVEDSPLDFASDPSKDSVNVEDSVKDKEATQSLLHQNEDSVEGKNDSESSSAIKPSMSYIALIGKAILESPQKRLNLGAIYCWIERSFPYFVNRGQGWRNSVRHNLSLNDCFIKAGRCEDGKGNYWAIHPANLQDFIRGDFRQRRRSRKRGKKREQEMGIYQMHNGYLSSTMPSPFQNIGFKPANICPTLNPLYSPYTEAERRAYKLDEALRQQGINNPLWNWINNNNYPNMNAPTNVNSGMYGTSSSQWTNYPDNSSHAMYPMNSTFTR